MIYICLALCVSRRGPFLSEPVTYSPGQIDPRLLRSDGVIDGDCAIDSRCFPETGESYAASCKG